MTNLFKRSLLLRLAVVLLTLTAPALSGCKDDNSTEEAANRVAEYKVIDDQLIQSYFTRHSITAGTGINQYRRLTGPNNNGLYLVKLAENPSTDTTTIISGNTAEVRYIGRLLRETNETTIFDNSTESSVPCGCIPVLVGAGRFIKGWDEGLLFMKKGDRYELLIPSYLAYGPGGTPTGTLRDEPLRFDMTILDVR
jgi:FKBP-type peptidyl-prolyl cis-trans isomerase